MSHQVKATVIAHSISSITGQEMITFELEFPRIVLAEFNTHNALSKNTSSSRAIPVKAMNEKILEDIGMPVRFGAKNAGMQDNGEHNELIQIGGSLMSPREAWAAAVETMVWFSEKFEAAGYAKQVCNRLTECGQIVKVVCTATDLANYYWLRDHFMADPTIADLASKMKAAHKHSNPITLEPGDWHVPYYNDGVWKAHRELEAHPIIVVDLFGHSLQNALDISASCCAQASYRKLDDTIEKARSVVERLNLGVDLTEPCHASPTEHQGTPIAPTIAWDSDEPWINATNEPMFSDTWQEGITHITREGVFGSGNLKNYIQYRQLIPGNVYTGGAA